MEADPLTTTQEVAQEFSVDHSVVIWHLRQIGKVKKFEKLVPPELTTNQKNHHFGVLSSLILHNSSEPFLDRIVICNKKWILYYNQQCTVVPVSLQLYRCCFLLSGIVFVFACFANSHPNKIYVKQRLLLVLICIALMLSDIKYLFLCFLSICISSVEKCLSKPFAHKDQLKMDQGLKCKS